MTILMLSFIGIPLTAGFTGKLLIFIGAMSVEGPIAWVYPTLALIGMVNAAIGVVLPGIVTVMYLRDAVKPIEMPGTYSGFSTVILCVVLTLGLSVPPAANWLLNAARQTTVRNATGGGAASGPAMISARCVASGIAALPFALDEPIRSANILSAARNGILEPEAQVLKLHLYLAPKVPQQIIPGQRPGFGPNPWVRPVRAKQRASLLFRPFRALPVVASPSQGVALG